MPREPPSTTALRLNTYSTRWSLCPDQISRKAWVHSSSSEASPEVELKSAQLGSPLARSRASQL